MIHMLLEMGREALLQGLIFGFVVIAVYMTSRVIRCDDLSIEGSFSFGGAVVASALFLGVHPLWSLPLALLSGGLAGALTGLLHTKFNMHHLIAGIVVTTGLYSINLNIAGANVSLMSTTTLFSYIHADHSGVRYFLLLALLAGLVFWFIKKFLRTEIGFLMRASGCNPALLASLGKSVNFYKILTFACAGACSGLAGGLFVQHASFYSITGSMGMMMLGLTGLIIAEMITKRFGMNLILGAILCQLFFALTIALGLDPSWNYLIRGGLIVLFMQISRKPFGMVLQ